MGPYGEAPTLRGSGAQAAPEQTGSVRSLRPARGSVEDWGPHGWGLGCPTTASLRLVSIHLPSLMSQHSSPFSQFYLRTQSQAEHGVLLL